MPVRTKSAEAARKTRSASVGLGAFALIATAGSALADTQPDAGILRQQIEQQLPREIPGSKRGPQAPVVEPTPSGGATVTVNAFRFDGNSRLSNEQISLALKPFVGRSLDFTGLQQAAAAVADAYERAGWLAKVYLPEQDVSEGVVTLQIVEGVFGVTNVEDGGARLRPGLAAAWIARAQRAGDPVNSTRLERALLLLDDLPGVSANGNFAAGKGEAETDLALKLGGESFFGGEVGLDNTGSRFTGRGRATLNANVRSPLRLGDLLTTNLLHTEGTDFGRLAYTVPVGYDGLQVGISGSYLDYKVILDDFAALGLQGSSATWGVDAQYPLVRSRDRNLYANLAYENKNYDNQANGATASNYSIRNINAGLTATLFDDFGGGGVSTATATATSGNVHLGSLQTGENASLDGHFYRLRYQLSRQQNLTERLSAYAALNGQITDRNLDSAERFYLGGPNGVRAYPVSEGGGAEGVLMNLELRYRLLNNLTVTGFYDFGQVTVSRSRANAASNAPNRYELQGAGVSFLWTAPAGITVRGIYARRIDDNPNPGSDGRSDQDGTLMRDRFWITATKAF